MIPTAIHMRRFIPAHAGNTLVGFLYLLINPVHPRSRGEHASAACATCAVHGSSPLTRGTLGSSPTSPRSQRFIPAHAGNTFDCELPEPKTPVHPRSRGEHNSEEETMQTMTGSSPLTRGTRPVSIALNAVTRFIPAHAGNTYPPNSHQNQLTGSSPLTRGTRLACWRGNHEDRFIPAHAGNTRPEQ